MENLACLFRKGWRLGVGAAHSLPAPSHLSVMRSVRLQTAAPLPPDHAAPQVLRSYRRLGWESDVPRGYVSDHMKWRVSGRAGLLLGLIDLRPGKARPGMGCWHGA